ncbi:hypothetical protein HMPREF9120_01630 [Neisseria sp. oral taxon 020 str. F0370]|nr:hypothetical protein HMPREF9120_01630 [Neisseria sp. oral taxon 020 str. F0370]
MPDIFCFVVNLPDINSRPACLKSSLKVPLQLSGCFLGFTRNGKGSLKTLIDLSDGLLFKQVHQRHQARLYGSRVCRA